MQDRYAGDIGDYVKLALLRALSPGHSLGVAWYRTMDHGPLGDGRHVGYLSTEHGDRWRSLDPSLHDALLALVASQARSIASLARIPIGTDVTYHDVPVAASTGRAVWFRSLVETMHGRDVVFLDPDNGVSLNQKSGDGRLATKRVPLDEIAILSKDRPATIIYHHQTRRPGGHLHEIADLGSELHQLHGIPVCAIRAGMWSPRVFFLMSPLSELWQRAEAFAIKWSPKVSFHPITPRPSDDMSISGDAPDDLGKRA